MLLYDIHTHRRKEGGISILNIYPQDYSEHETGYVSCGIHPWYITGDESFERLESVVQQPNVVAIGETGFDSLRGPSMETQKKCFEKHIEISEKYEKPLIIHCVKAWDWLLASQRKYNPKQAWIIHGFRGKAEQMQQLVDKGMMFSIGEKFNEQAVQLIPSDRLFCETDDSNMSIEEIYRLIAQARNMDLIDLVDNVAKNVNSVFRI